MEELSHIDPNPLEIERFPYIAPYICYKRTPEEYYKYFYKTREIKTEPEIFDINNVHIHHCKTLNEFSQLYKDRFQGDCHIGIHYVDKFNSDKTKKRKIWETIRDTGKFESRHGGVMVFTLKNNI